MSKRAALVTFVMLMANAGTAQAFSSYEHSEIGDAAFASAIATLDRAPGATARLFASQHLANVNAASGRAEPICAVASGTNVVCFSFGDLLAIYGDFAEGFDEVNSHAIGARAAALKQIVKLDNVASFPSEKHRMLELAAKNATHFAQIAAQAYVQWHGKALELAPQKDRLWEALHYEALALHSFTDLFAVGHMLENRQKTDELVKWAQAAHSRIASGLAVAGSEVMGGFVNFYHNAYNWEGAKLKNLAGESWRGFGDGKYRIVDAACAHRSYQEQRSCVDPTTKDQREIIVRAVALSLSKVLNAANGTPPAAGTAYEALNHLPVEYADARSPVHPQHQVLHIVRLAIEMKKQGRPIQDNGFDFSLGYLQYEQAQTKGSVDYTDFVRQHARR